MKRLQDIFAPLMLATLLACAGPLGCQKEEGALEKAGKKADGLLERAGEAAKDALEKAKN